MTILAKTEPLLYLILILIVIYAREAHQIARTRKLAAVRANAALHRLSQQMADFLHAHAGVAVFSKDRPFLQPIIDRIETNCDNNIPSSKEMQELSKLIGQKSQELKEGKLDAASFLINACRNIGDRKTSNIAISLDKEMDAFARLLKAHEDNPDYPFEKETSQISYSVANYSCYLQLLLFKYYRWNIASLRRIRSVQNLSQAKTTINRECAVMLQTQGQACDYISKIWLDVNTTCRTPTIILWFKTLFS